MGNFNLTVEQIYELTAAWTYFHAAMIVKNGPDYCGSDAKNMAKYEAWNRIARESLTSDNPPVWEYKEVKS